MSLLQILHYPDNRLRKIAQSVSHIDNSIHDIINNMFDTMYYMNGIGLAATQVNIHKKIIVIDISEDHNDKLTLINPKILERSGEIGIKEGCLSIPEQRGFVLRAKKIRVIYLDIHGNPFEMEACDLLSICIQHEVDHLVGKLFIDYLSPLQQNRIYQRMKRYKNIIKNDKYGS